MDNQHKKITGYRDLTQEEIDLMNEIKELANKCGDLVDKLRTLPTSYDPVDIRWLSIGQTHLQQGFMAVTRSIAKPESF